MRCSADLLVAAADNTPKAKAEATFKAEKTKHFVSTLRKALHNTFRY